MARRGTKPRVSIPENTSTAENAPIAAATAHPPPQPTATDLSPEREGTQVVDAAPLSSDDTESGWAAIAQSIREVDEQKVKDYKEDIDTFLVFAGLFSAVLSALLVDSYKTLQPDPNIIMITLLSQLVNQTHTYSLSPAFANSTVSPLDTYAVEHPPIPLVAKRVNVLWFASLTLSLMSASFAILVKQWLREYLADENISPRARLRIRHFREPGLSNWHVFAIAALLPQLLQLALALFFVGLCIFTRDIHPSIGYTTIPLVAGWSLLIIITIFAPVFFLRCPYKSPMFKSLAQLLRKGLFHLIRLLNCRPVLPAKTQWPTIAPCRWWWLDYSEEDVAKDAHSDFGILVAVDNVQTDDRLVKNMCTALAEMHVSPDKMLDLVLKVINSRLQADIQKPLVFMPILNLSQLPVQTCTILMDTVADVLDGEVKRVPISGPKEWSDLTRDCLSLLVSRLPCSLSDKAAATVSLCFAGTQGLRSQLTCKLLFKNVRGRGDRYKLCQHLQERLQDVLLHLNAYQIQKTMLEMLKQSCCTCGNSGRECELIEDVLEVHKSAIPSLLRQHACDILIAYMSHQIKVGATWNERHTMMLFTLVNLWKHLDDDDPEPWHPALLELVRQLYTEPKSAQHFWRPLFFQGEYRGSQGLQAVFRKAFCQSDVTEQILANTYDVISSYLTETAEMSVRLEEDFYFRLVSFIAGQIPLMRHIVESNNRYIVRLLYRPLYRRLWNKVHTALSHFNPEMTTDVLMTRASFCLQDIDEFDRQWLPASEIGADASTEFEKWATIFKPRQSFFDDSIIRDLAKFVPVSMVKETIPDFKSDRLERLLWLRRTNDQDQR